MDSLWNIKNNVDTQNPIEVLEEQAKLLLQATNNKVGATVLKSTDKSGNFLINFLITSPSLPNYSFKVFSITFSPALFPFQIICDENIKKELGWNMTELFSQSKEQTCNNYDEFLEILAKILGSNYVGQVIHSVMMMATTDFTF